MTRRDKTQTQVIMLGNDINDNKEGCVSDGLPHGENIWSREFLRPGPNLLWERGRLGFRAQGGRLETSATALSTICTVEYIFIFFFGPWVT